MVARQPGVDAQMSGRVVFLLDVDNTLLDNDALKDDMAARLRAVLGDALAARFWLDYEAVRDSLGTVDLPLTFERFRASCGDETLTARAREAVMEYPFATRLYPETLHTIAYLASIGTPVILSDGDSVYQPRKIERSGLAAAVGGRVLVVVHKEDHLREVMERWPAPFYVLVDDKERILATTKQTYPQRIVTVQVMQGHYALSGEHFAPPPDLTIPHIGVLRQVSIAHLRAVLDSSP